ncbi:MAG: hypothetical protein AAFN30_18545 [Actinomycetota bacterium]
MATYKCLVNRSLGTALEQRLAEGLTFITVNRFGPDPEPVEVSFTEVEAGRWYTAGKPSDSTMVLGSVPAGTPQDVREAHMAEVARFFSETTGDHIDQVMVVAADARTATDGSERRKGRN